MTLFAQRNDIKPMFGVIAKMMMVTTSGFAAILAFEVAGRAKLVGTDSAHNCDSGRDFPRISQTILLSGTATTFFARFGLLIAVFGCFACLRLVTHFLAGIPARFAATAKAGRSIAPYTKVRNWLDLLAFRAGLCLNVVKHIISFANSMSESFVGTHRQATRFIVSSLTEISITNTQGIDLWRQN